MQQPTSIPLFQEHAAQEAARTGLPESSMKQASPHQSPEFTFAGRRVHFIGVGGSGMNGLALMLERRGAIVTGSDQSDGAAITRLDPS